MKKNEIIEHNLSLTFEFLRQIIDDLSLIKEIPNGSVIEFIQPGLPIKESKKKTKKKFIRVTHQFEMINSIKKKAA